MRKEMGLRVRASTFITPIYLKALETGLIT
jgi:hypothetical protein